MAYVYYPSDSNCGVIPAYSCTPCNRPELGRVRSIAIVSSSFVFLDHSNSTEWDAGILSGDIEVIWETQGSFDGGVIQELPGFGDRAFSNGGITFTLTYKDPNLIKNVDFYNATKNVSDKRIIFRTETQIWDSGVPVTFQPKIDVQDDLLSQVLMAVTVKWQSQNLPVNYDTPSGIFDECYAVAA